MDTKQEIRADELEVFADELTLVATRYREMAATMTEHDIESIPLTGWTTALGRLSSLQSHLGRAENTLDKELSAQRLAAKASSPRLHVADDSESERKSRKAKKKPE